MSGVPKRHLRSVPADQGDTSAAGPVEYADDDWGVEATEAFYSDLASFLPSTDEEQE